MDSGNWEAELPTGDTNKQYYINVCRSLVKQKGWCKGYSNVITSTSGLEFKYNSGPNFYVLKSTENPSPCYRLMEVSLHCSVMPEGWRWILESGSGPFWSYVGRKCPNAAVHQRPGLFKWKPQQDQYHPLPVWQKQSGKNCTQKMVS